MIENRVVAKKFLNLILFFLLIVSFGCAKKESKLIKIGCITPLTGDGASYGKSTKQGIDMAVEEINTLGGINGNKIEIIYEDDQMKPQMGINAIQKLITVDKVSVIIGAFGSSITLAIAPIAEKNKTILFSASSTADAIKDAGDYIFRNVPPNSKQGKDIANFCIDKLKAKTAAIFYMNNDYGISLKRTFEKAFYERGGTVVSIESYNPNDNDFRTQLSKIKIRNPEIISYPGHYKESGLILKQAKELGIKSTFIGGDGSFAPELIKIAGNAAESSFYAMMAMGFGVSDTDINKFTERFKEKYGEEPSVYSAYAYDALMIIVEAIKRGGDTSESIKNALYQMKNFKGVTGITTFDKFGEVDKAFYIYEVKSGEFKLYEK